MEGDHARKLLLHGEYTQTHPSVSPNGQYIAYTSAESSKFEIYVRPFPEVNKGRWQISTGGGNTPLWSRDGLELFYLNGDAVMEVSVDTKSGLSAGKPRILFRGAYVTGYGEEPSWDINPDGKRFLMMKPPASTAPASATAAPRQKIIVVVNWFEELKQRVPIK
jgi:serine/threonine-protein kinase